MTTTKRMGAVADDWFRSPAWDEAARADFEARLGHARPGNWQQYLGIKGVSLRAAGNVEAGLPCGDPAKAVLFNQAAPVAVGAVDHAHTEGIGVQPVRLVAGELATPGRLDHHSKHAMSQAPKPQSERSAGQSITGRCAW